MIFDHRPPREDRASDEFGQGAEPWGSPRSEAWPKALAAPQPAPCGLLLVCQFYRLFLVGIMGTSCTASRGVCRPRLSVLDLDRFTLASRRLSYLADFPEESSRQIGANQLISATRDTSRSARVLT